MCWSGCIVTVVAIAAAGCVHSGSMEKPQTRRESPPEPTVVARYAQDGIVLDGKLDDKAWRHASVYPLYLTDPEVRAGKTVGELSYAMFAWDDSYFYAAMKCEDTDVVAEAKEDQESHWQEGDTTELFLKSPGRTWYWELYGTPAGKKANLFIPGRGRLWLDSLMEYECGLKAAAAVDGTLNNWRDTDTGWVVEMAMPIADLTALGDTFGEGARWTVLIARVNYSRTLSHMEMSSWPPLPKRDYHLYEHYAPLKLVK